MTIEEQVKEQYGRIMNVNDGGPAFPKPYSTDEHSNPCNIGCEEQGMSLRDYAALSVAPILAEIYWRSGAEAGVDFDYVSAESFKFADSLLKAR